MPQIVVALGSNLPPREAYLSLAVEALQRHAAQGTWCLSPCFETAPVGGIPQPDYLNAVAAFEAAWEPQEALAILRSIEEQAQRQRTIRWGARTLDLDLLFVDQCVGRWDVPFALELPHPRLHLRRFVLAPLAALLPQFIHPVLQCSAEELLQRCVDSSSVLLYTPQDERLRLPAREISR